MNWNLDCKVGLIPSCILTNGFHRSLICDSERELYFLIPKSLDLILTSYYGLSINEIMSKYSEQESKKIIFEYFDFLYNNSLLLISNNITLYKKISRDYYYHGDISNAILDLNEKNIDKIDFVVEQLSTVFCNSVQIRMFCHFHINAIFKLLGEFVDSTVEWIEIICQWIEEYSNFDWEVLFKKFPRVRVITLYNSSSEKVLYSEEFGMGRVIATLQNIDSIKDCGIISSKYFAIDIKAISEATHFNSCLNKKISIDLEGNIKNCPSMSESFGNIKNTTLSEAIEKPGFKKYWNITKDKIHVCKDCEFRYICTDCRAYVEDPSDLLSKPLKCGYNPYTGEWTEWSINPMKEKAIEFYEMEELVSKRKHVIVNREKD